MNPHYAVLQSELRGAAALEKLASCEEPDLSTSAQYKLAEVCDALYERVKATADSIPGDLPRKEASALGIVDFMLSLRDAQQVVGVKTAASREEVLECANKLATAAYVDEVLCDELTKISGEDYNQVREVQLLGREYAVNLMQGLMK